MERCDFCDKEYPYAARRVAALPRPSDPTELVAVMWGCGECPGSAELPTVEEIFAAESDNYLFITV